MTPILPLLSVPARRGSSSTEAFVSDTLFSWGLTLAIVVPFLFFVMTIAWNLYCIQIEAKTPIDTRAEKLFFQVRLGICLFAAACITLFPALRF